RIRLFPLSDKTQSIVSWALKIGGAREEVRFSDQFGNDTRLLSAEGEAHQITIEASGEVDTHNRAGVVGPHKGFAPLWLFRRETQLTAVGEGVTALAGSIGKGAEIDRLHRLMATIREKVAFLPGTTDTGTTAELSLAQASGVCQDHAHIFIASARRLGFPARYVSGYLMMNDRLEQVASHAWAEAHVDGLGWVAFDVANGIAPDERYVRIATGRDYRDAMPVSGIRLGQAEEQLEVRITVEQ
ncbi:MAG TPA: transglutaminase family protein, partial [Rhizobiaceae bacterium]|nr:transglutaminase family protein [Rhizobiaceae bacterium]